jgi:F-type H+-transporting ATPase subunit b
MFDEKFWLAISFAFFAILIAKYVWPLMISKIDDSSKKIASDVEAAKNLKIQAEELLLEAKKHHQETVEHCKKLAIDAEDEVKKLIISSQSSLEHEIKIKLDAAVTRIKNQEENIVRDLKNKIVEDAFEKVKKDLVTNLDQSKNNKLVDSKIISGF